MQEPAVPLDEAQRLKALRSLAILDTPREERFDRILRLATRLFGVPMAAITLVDENRQWFKSKIGVAVDGTPRSVSFCGHAILGSETMVVPDALLDPRFADNPLVTGEPAIRFYAGHPLRLSGGQAVGAICILDREARELSMEDQASLADLACMVEKELGSERDPELYNRVSRAEDEARIAWGAKRRFLSNIIHELRTPLNGVLGMCQLMAGGTLDAEQKQNLEVIRDSSETFLTVIDDLLDFTNVELGVAVGRSEAFNPFQVLCDAVRPFKAECARKGLRMVADISAGLPPSVIGDAGRVRQIVVNLMGNAVEFTRKGMVRLESQWIPGSESDGQLILRVKDTGPGIRSDRLADLFQGYSSKDGSPNVSGAAGGLGLAITKRLVESMKGELEVASLPGKGTNFTVGLRLRLDASPLKAAPAPAAPALSGVPALSPVSAPLRPVLLVEDNAVNLIVAKRMLEKLGLDVETAGNGVEALNKLARQSYAAIFMDCAMPDMDGYAATRNIRSSNAPWSDLPIIAVTAFASPEEREECLEAGMDDHIAKPIKFEALEAAVNRYVRKRT